MNDLLKTILSLSLSGSLLILILLLCKPLFKYRLSKRWQYYIWIVVISRLLLSFAPEINLIGNVFDGIENKTFSTVESSGLDTSLSETSGSTVGRDNYDDTDTDNKTLESSISHTLSNLWLVWVVVALILIIRKVTIYKCFIRYIKAGSNEVSDIDQLEQFGKIMEQANVKRIVELKTNSLVSSPILIGFFRSCIVLPNAEITASDFRYIILHELIHCRRRDMFYKWLVQITICVHWFNPLVYLMGREINRACELSCDEAVIRKMDFDSMRLYGDTLLNIMGIGGNYKSTLASVTFNESKELLKERLDAILKFKKQSKFIVVVTLWLTMLLGMGATVVGAYETPKLLIINPHVLSNVTNDKVVSENISDKALGDYHDNSTIMQTAKVGSTVYYLVDTQQQLRSIGKGIYKLDMNYMQNRDITLKEEWVPIGTLKNPFSGVFNGNGFEIIDLKMTDPNAKTIGLFGHSKNAQIYNITLRNLDIETAGGNGKTVGAICAWATHCNIYDNQIINPVKD